jgi:hypothetical protein
MGNRVFICCANNEGDDIYFELLASVKPNINGQNTYQRILVRRVEYLDIIKCPDEILAIFELADPGDLDIARSIRSETELFTDEDYRKNERFTTEGEKI